MQCVAICAIYKCDFVLSTGGIFIKTETVLFYQQYNWH